MPKSQPRVVDPQKMQDRGVEVVNVYDILLSLVAELVGRAVGNSPFDAPPAIQIEKPLM